MEPGLFESWDLHLNKLGKGRQNFKHLSQMVLKKKIFSSPARKYRELLLPLWRWCWRHTLKFYVEVFFMLWARHCQASCPVRGQVLCNIFYIFLWFKHRTFRCGATLDLEIFI